MDPRWLSVLSLLLHIPFASAQQCEIPRGNAEAVRSLNAVLLKVAADPSRPPNPSIYLALRLSDQHNFTTERQYLKRLVEIFQPNTGSPPSEVDYEERFGTGQLALYLLALRAACQNMRTVARNQLITQLKMHLHKEMEHIGNQSIGHPLSNYYQYSLGVLAMCAHHKKIDEHVIDKLLDAEEKGKFQLDHKFSVDTAAMAGLAFGCLKDSHFYTAPLLAKLSQAVQRVTGNILLPEPQEGISGNIYSRPLVMQLLMGTRTDHLCARDMHTLLHGLARGVFHNSLIQSQLLPVLYGKSYLDIADMRCHAERGAGEADSLIPDLSSPEPRRPSQTGERIAVHLVVYHPSNLKLLYKRLLKAPAGSSLLEILMAATKLGQKPLRFQTENTLSGPMITAMMGVKARKGERKYWRILGGGHRILEQGIADYIPQDRETISFRFVSW
ncbi:transcobalamin-2 isoform X1 [Varanus komodoensis]|uniref:transcobalamin-2 isoform X1 n=1 Tax=Varanus komodoensis TaxID=61221 RepID=UPI001CF7ADB3|nr:transcobalamin-2 isoform X1 [Varanus komodoensis]XP_044304891.1 transcobalamin-2 isoform X1 [Varanus komodoensis]